MSGQLLWLVAFLLYVYDSVSVRDRDAVLRYSIEGVTAALVMPSLTVAGHRIFIPNPIRPDHCDLLLTKRTSAELSPLDRYLIDRASWMYRVHQIVSLGCLLALFVVAPLLTKYMNLLDACLISVGLTFWLCTFHWLEMWKNRNLLGIGGKTLKSDIVHVLLCPPNAVNCARRISALRHPCYGVLPTLMAFSRFDAEKYQEQFCVLAAPR